MNVEIQTEVAQFPEKEYIKWDFRFSVMSPREFLLHFQFELTVCTCDFLQKLTIPLNVTEGRFM